MKITGKIRYFQSSNSNMILIEESSNPKIEEIFKEIPCAVCHSASSGIHFGATTCEVSFIMEIYLKLIIQHVGL